ncbi:MAG: hypothetical protein MJZ34_05460 [Paludibacteraceae bacterium]|nr:hypothetical protein [Paludibacteraceae bacterium]
MITIKQFYNELRKLISENKGDYEFILGNYRLDELEICVADCFKTARIFVDDRGKATKVDEETKQSESAGASSPKRIAKSKYDENGNHYDYDIYGHIVHFKRIDGYEEWTDYDIQGNMAYYKNNHGIEKWFEHDWDGNLTGWGWGNPNPKA